jgi:hypothetical protein
MYSAAAAEIPALGLLIKVQRPGAGLRLVVGFDDAAERGSHGE